MLCHVARRAQSAIRRGRSRSRDRAPSRAPCQGAVSATKEMPFPSATSWPSDRSRFKAPSRVRVESCRCLLERHSLFQASKDCKPPGPRVRNRSRGQRPPLRRPALRLRLLRRKPRLRGTPRAASPPTPPLSPPHNVFSQFSGGDVCAYGHLLRPPRGFSTHWAHNAPADGVTPIQIPADVQPNLIWGCLLR